MNSVPTGPSIFLTFAAMRTQMQKLPHRTPIPTSAPARRAQYCKRGQIVEHYR